MANELARLPVYPSGRVESAERHPVERRACSIWHGQTQGESSVVLDFDTVHDVDVGLSLRESEAASAATAHRSFQSPHRYRRNVGGVRVLNEAPLTFVCRCMTLLRSVQSSDWFNGSPLTSMNTTDSLCSR